MMIEMPPFFFFIAAAILTLVLPLTLRRIVLLTTPLLALVAVQTIPDGIHFGYSLLSQESHLLKVDSLNRIFGYIFCLISFLAALYALNNKDRLEQTSALLYAGSALGVTFAGDFFTLYVFWELMAVASTFVILAGRTVSARNAAFRYVLVHLFGGLCLLAGIVLKFEETGSLAVEYVGMSGFPALLILIGVAVNAAIPPMHAWLKDAYPLASYSGSVFLSAFTTKTAIYVLARCFAGVDMLVPLGVCMALYGVVYAVLENDFRRLLAYHIISQVGFMVTGVGLGTQLAINGTCAHAFAHILYKGLLFMGCGSVVLMTGKSKFTELGGLYKKMPNTFLFTLVGGLSISAFPFFSGFVSKAMVTAAGFEAHEYWAGFLLLLASAGTFLHTGLKIPYFIWFGKNNCDSQTWEKAQDPPLNMQLGMALTAFLCIFIGSYTPYLYNMLPYAEAAHAYNPYSLDHVSETMQILFFTALGFFLFVKKLTPEEKISIDTDWFYRKGGELFYAVSDTVFNTINDVFDRGFARKLPERLNYFLGKPVVFIFLSAVKLLLLLGVNSPEFQKLASWLNARHRSNCYPIGGGVLLAISFLATMSVLYLI